MDKFSFFPLPDIGRFKVIAQPEGKGKGFWAEGCSSLKDDKGKIWLAYRLRNPEKRGHKVCIAASQDGVNLQTVKELYKKDFSNIVCRIWIELRIRQSAGEALERTGTNI